MAHLNVILYNALYGELQTQRPHSCIPQEDSAETLLPIGPGDCIAADARDGKGG